MGPGPSAVPGLFLWARLARGGASCAFPRPPRVWARRFDRDASPRGPDFPVSGGASTTAQRDPRVAAARHGQYAVVWGEATPPPGTALGVFARVYEASGSPVGDQFQVSSGTGYLPAVAALPSGFVAVWGRDTDMFGRRFDVRGRLQGAEFMVNTNTGGTQYVPTVAPGADGGFVIVWANGFQAVPRGIFARRFDASGTAVGAELQVNASTTIGKTLPLIGSDAAGNFVVVWSENGDTTLVGRRLDPTGMPLGAEFLVSALAGGPDSSPIPTSPATVPAT